MYSEEAVSKVFIIISKNLGETEKLQNHVSNLLEKSVRMKVAVSAESFTHVHEIRMLLRYVYLKETNLGELQKS